MTFLFRSVGLLAIILSSSSGLIPAQRKSLLPRCSLDLQSRVVCKAEPIPIGIVNGPPVAAAMKNVDRSQKLYPAELSPADGDTEVETNYFSCFLLHCYYSNVDLVL